MNPRTIRITEPCEFGELGERIRPEPYDVAALLVETRGVAVYDDGPEKLADPSVPPVPRVPRTSEAKKHGRRGTAFRGNPTVASAIGFP